MVYLGRCPELIEYMGICTEQLYDSVQDSYEEQEFWMTRLDWFGIRLNQFEMFEEHENCLSRWKQCCSKFETVLSENHV